MRLLVLLTTILILGNSCNEKIYTGDVDCSECYVPRPDSVDLIIDLTINNEFSAVPLVIYKGDIEDGVIEWIDTAYASPYYLYVPVDRRYSVKGEYRRGNKKLFAVDGTNVKVLLVSDACDAECYVVENVTMDIRIKKEFLDF
jgi:hypothetical protein